MKFHTIWRQLCVTVACTALAVALLTLTGCEEPVSKPAAPEPETEAPAEPEPTATELLAGKYEVTTGYWGCSGENCVSEFMTETYLDPLVLHADGTVSTPSNFERYERWSFYPERRALILWVDLTPPAEVERGVLLVLSNEWRTGDPLCLQSVRDLSDDTVYCTVKLQRMPVPADGGQTIKTPPATQDDLPSEWVGTYEASIGPPEARGTIILKLRDDGVFGYSIGSAPLIVAGQWWFDASGRALALTVTNQDSSQVGNVAYVFPKGWDGSSICVTPADSTECGMTIRRLPK